METGLQLSLLNLEVWHPHSDKCRWSSHLFLSVRKYSHFTCGSHWFTYVPILLSHVVPIGLLILPVPTLSYLHYLPFFWTELSFLSSKWRQLFPGRHWYLCTRLHVKISQKTVTLIFTFCLFAYLMIMLFAQIPIIKRMVVIEEYKEHGLVWRYWFRICVSTEKLFCSVEVLWPIS